MPSELGTNKTIIAFYRKLLSFLQNRKDQNQCENAIQVALDTYDIMKQKIIVHWTKNPFILNEMKNSLDDYFFDVVKKEMRIDFNNENLDDVVESLN
ncbi:hypothetical protein N7280_05110 [Rickettsia rhipicephali]|uniref:hypothetical protein n=1 Tax=Rickettsia rhipicephali TaxID=33992 RepID=UPI00225B21D2|nr:hypothetical protein [Rickettsia rhipicephali]MCX4079972.1 hypothetical protein [Rickettsia rhipicephali]